MDFAVYSVFPESLFFVEPDANSVVFAVEQCGLGHYVVLPKKVAEQLVLEQFVLRAVEFVTGMIALG